MGFGERQGGRGGGFGGGGGGGFRRPMGPREMHKAVCADCGKECEVPFKPIEGKPVYCKECYANHKQPRSDF
jgi:CxxC-x17-CxxC domain-containing protein